LSGTYEQAHAPITHRATHFHLPHIRKRRPRERANQNQKNEKIKEKEREIKKKRNGQRQRNNERNRQNSSETEKRREMQRSSLQISVTVCQLIWNGCLPKRAHKHDKDVGSRRWKCVWRVEAMVEWVKQEFSFPTEFRRKNTREKKSNFNRS
jgi:hypothetical protein